MTFEYLLTTKCASFVHFVFSPVKSVFFHKAQALQKLLSGKIKNVGVHNLLRGVLRHNITGGDVSSSDGVNASIVSDKNRYVGKGRNVANSRRA